MKKVNFKTNVKQAGFTLIELIVVIVILGVMAATALPKFMDLGADARVAKMQAASGSIKSAVAMANAAWRAAGSPSAGGTYNDVVVNSDGFPAEASIADAAGLTDYEVDTATAGTASITPDTEHTACIITYTAATGVVSDAPAVTDCD